MPKILRCECGKPWSECTYAVHRSGDRRILYYRCQGCALEWTVIETDVDLAEPVTADEVIEAHKLLERSHLTIEELIREHRT